MAQDGDHGGPQLEPPVACVICGKEFRNKVSLGGHMRMHPGRGWRGINFYLQIDLNQPTLKALAPQQIHLNQPAPEALAPQQIHFNQHAPEALPPLQIHLN
uniref:C2H2-type domain-containing protein n=1 Tax=Fagus sylvatica TaxID=28930 RepID=A0A2N9IL32_FAGSY